jgi:hypothetical protein
MGRARVPVAHNDPWPHVRPACTHARGCAVMARSPHAIALSALSAIARHLPLPTSTRLVLILAPLQHWGKAHSSSPPCFSPAPLCISSSSALPAKVATDVVATWAARAAAIVRKRSPLCGAPSQAARVYPWPPLSLASSNPSFTVRDSSMQTASGHRLGRTTLPRASHHHPVACWPQRWAPWPLLQPTTGDSPPPEHRCRGDPLPVNPSSTQAPKLFPLHA